MTIMNRELVSICMKLAYSGDYSKIMLLKIYVDESDPELKSMYIEAVKKHNAKILECLNYCDAGFDILVPSNPPPCVEHSLNTIDFKIKTSARLFDIYAKGMDCSVIQKNYTSYYVYARSSIAKTPLRLANNQGIIDAGYRGNLKGMFDFEPQAYTSDFTHLEPYSRLLQICGPALEPVLVMIVDNVNDLSTPTLRGECGIGSTGH